MGEFPEIGHSIVGTEIGGKDIGKQNVELLNKITEKNFPIGVKRTTSSFTFSRPIPNVQHSPTQDT